MTSLFCCCMCECGGRSSPDLGQTCLDVLKLQGREEDVRTESDLVAFE